MRSWRWRSCCAAVSVRTRCGSGTQHVKGHTLEAHTHAFIHAAHHQCTTIVLCTRRGPSALSTAVAAHHDELHLIMMNFTRAMRVQAHLCACRCQHKLLPLIARCIRTRTHWMQSSTCTHKYACMLEQPVKCEGVRRCCSTPTISPLYLFSSCSQVK